MAALMGEKTTLTNGVVGMDEPLTEPEWLSVTKDFPQLVRDQCRKTGEATPTYNCIAWSVGVTNDRFDPPNPIEKFIQFYRERGFVTCGAGEATIDGWQTADGVMTHGSCIDNDHGGSWSSKLGNNIRITHQRDALQGGLYGHIVEHFKAGAAKEAMDPERFREAPVPRADAELLAGIAADFQTSFGPLADGFEEAWSRWQAEWYDPTFAPFAPSSEVYCHGRNWERLVAMGTNILPLVVAKLADKGNVNGCRLYNVLQPDASMVVSSENLQVYYNLWNQAKTIRKLYAAGARDFESAAADWRAELAATADATASSTGDPSSPAYARLVQAGQGAVPLIMIEYGKDHARPWHMLLEHIVNGRFSNATASDEIHAWNLWNNWFLSG